MSNNHWDIIIIGTGAGGGTLLHRLAPSGKRILVLERGAWLPREKANWDTVEVFQKDRYHTKEVWYDKAGKKIHPGTGYWVGGNTKVYGAALLRLRERDFEKVHLKDGSVSPEWPLKYRDFEPYYTAAEELYHVHGKRGLNPTEPKAKKEYAYPQISHEPRIEEIRSALEDYGLKPFYLPLGVLLNEEDPRGSPCIRCDSCDGFPCLVNAKCDSDVMCVRPALERENVTLMTNAQVTKLLTSSSGREITEVEADVQGERTTFRGDVVIVACGAINSAVLLLRSASDRYPKGLANRSDQVGRNFMKHHNGAIMGVSKKPNATRFQKTLAVNDFYWGEEDFEFPMGHVQLLGKVNAQMLAGDAPGFAPGVALEQMAAHSIDWWLTAEDPPHSENRVRVEGERTILEHTDRGTDGFDRLMDRWKSILKTIDAGDSIFPNAMYFRKRIPLQAVGHQCGTARFGADPSTSVLDLDCKAHELDNLYVVDGSFFPSSAAVNPSLTIMANALRVGDHLLERMKS